MHLPSNTSAFSYSYQLNPASTTHTPSREAWHPIVGRVTLLESTGNCIVIRMYRQYIYVYCSIHGIYNTNVPVLLYVQVQCYVCIVIGIRINWVRLPNLLVVS